MKHSLVLNAFEFVTYGFGFLMAWHAWFKTRGIQTDDSAKGVLDPADHPNRARWLSTLLWGMVFGLGLECLLVARNDYSYGTFQWMFDNRLEPGLKSRVPAWVGVGWGIVLYSTTWTAQRLKLPALSRALFAGLLALTIDLCLDPVAARYDLWYWPSYDVKGPPLLPEGETFTYARFFGVPYDNFVCWFLIVASYTGFVRQLFRLVDWAKKKFKLKLNAKLVVDIVSAVLVPLIGGGGSIWLVLKIDAALPSLYWQLQADLPILLFVLGVACLIVALSISRPPRDLKISLPVIAVPITYAVLSWLTLLLNGAYKDELLSPMLMVIPAVLLVAVLSFNLVSLERLLPHRAGEEHAPAESGENPIPLDGDQPVAT